MDPQKAVFGFERLEVWQKAVELAGSVYSVTKQFPREEMFGMTMQLRRAAVSVSANIAEGASRASAKDQAHFFEIAYGSLNEQIAILHIAQRQGFVDAQQMGALRDDIATLCKMLSGLRRSALARTGVTKP